MCKTLFIRAETDDGKPHPGLPGPVELDSYVRLDGEPSCLCNLDDPDQEGDAARAAFMVALRPFLKAVSWGNIIIEVR